MLSTVGGYYEKCGGNGKIQYMGNEITDAKIIAKVCNEHFVTIGKKLAEVVHTGDSSPQVHLNRADIRFKFKSVTADQIQQTTSKLINSEATGIHNTVKTRI